jgi:lipoprotein-anchoring transpeptidase ErfK/SrfK
VRVALRRLGAFLVILLVAAALSGVAAPSAGQFSRVPAGVSIAGLPVGGFTSEDARGLLRERLSEPVRFELGAKTWKATAEQLGVDAGVDAAIAAALHAPTGASVDVAASASRPDLTRYVRYLDKTLSRAPRDAFLAGLDSKLRPVIATEVPGRRLDAAAAAAAIEASVRSAEREPVRLTFTSTPAKKTAAAFGPVIVIRRGSNTLTLFEGSRVVQRFGVATGQSRYPTPLGTFPIVTMQYNPWWYPPDSDWAKGLKPVPPGPGNPLGTRWMGLSAWGVGIHGTPDAASIGYSASHGCIRMRIPDAEWLFRHVEIGTPVFIISK